MRLDRLSGRSFLALGIALSFGGGRLEAQAAAPAVIYACYVPLTGTVYRIREPDTKPACTAASHVAFSWTDGADAVRVTSHGALTGLTNDDHPQYLLADGARSAVSGFAVTGTLNSGGIPASGTGTRMMWYPAKGAFRAGSVSFGEWNEANVGEHSLAIGQNVVAIGTGSTALGLGSVTRGAGALAVAGGVADGSAAFAMGSNSFASGTNAFAFGNLTEARGNNGIAMGASARASGPFSVALGTRASTNGFNGSFVYGDNSGTQMNATATNQFSVLASGGVRLRTSTNLATGCDLAAGSGTWTCTSSRLAKERFENLNGDDVLRKIAGMPIQEWSYRNERGNTRHVGPTAQDFRAAFGLGTSDDAIALVDIDGVNMLGVQTLARRTGDQASEIKTLRTDNARLAARVSALEQAITRLMAGERRP